MSLRLTIDIFSGRPNPVVEMTGKEAEEILRRATPESRIDIEDGGPPPPTLGYRGILFEFDDKEDHAELPRRFRLAGGQLFGLGLAHHVRDTELEDYLLAPEGPFSREEVGIDDFFPKVTDLKDQLLELKWLKKWPWWDDFMLFPWPRPCSCGPIYEPSWWNVPARQPHNNCYNYATNYRTDTFAQPGEAASAKYTSLTCVSVRPAAVADKLIDWPEANNKCPEEGHLVALVVAPGWDYHWYRKDRTGWWSHKPGGTPVTNLDNAGNTIFDPRSAARGPYTDFCTFMVVMHGHVKIK